MSPAVRKHIVRSCKARDWTIQPAALQAIENEIAREANPAEALEVLLDRLSSWMQEKKTISQQIIEKSLEEGPTIVKNAQKISVVNAFQMPKLFYEVMRKQFRIVETPGSLFGDPEDKAQMLMQRYSMIHQRLSRHESFRPKDINLRTVQYKLTPIETLLGKDSMENSLLLLGILIQIEEGHYYLEDPTGQVRVSFQNAVVVDGFFVTEYSILLVEGVFSDGIFYIESIGQPLLEKRDASLQVISQQLHHPSYAPSRKSDLSDDVSFVFLSDVHLDQPRVLQQLEALFATYENYSQARLPCFVLMGNFCSQYQIYPTDHLRTLLDELATLIARFSNISQHANVVLVPGPNDGVGQVLPFPSLKSTSLQHRVANLSMASNPCRIHFQGKEMVVFRYDLLHTFQMHQIRLESVESEPHTIVIKTILDQGHLLPVSNIPVYWNYDHALRLYPLPNILVLGDVSSPYYEVYEGCHVIHAGSMAQRGEYAVCSPEEAATSTDEFDDASPFTVEFGKLGVDKM